MKNTNFVTILFLFFEDNLKKIYLFHIEHLIRSHCGATTALLTALLLLQITTKKEIVREW